MRKAWIVAIAIALAGCGRGEDDSKRAASLEVYGHLPQFALTDQSGKTFGSEQLAGQVAIINFIFTRCPTVCPTFSLKFLGIQKSLGDAPIQYVSISVDPTHDTPEVLAKYAADLGATARWKFLTGDPELITKTAETGLKLALERRGRLEDGTPDIVHASHFVLVDSQGRLRGYYDSDVKDRRQALAQDARALAAATD